MRTLKAVKKNASKRKIKTLYVSLVLDESGSMGGIVDETIKGVNEQIQTLHKSYDTNKDKVRVIVSLIKFNDKVNPIFLNKNLDDVKEIGYNDYRPDCSTAMYDAVGFAINSLNTRVDINDKTTSVLVIVVSDGMENASKEYDSIKIADSISNLNKTKRWTFTYIGANQDLSKVSKSTGIHYGNTLLFDNNSLGTQKAFTLNANSLTMYAGEFIMSKEAFSKSNFYAQEDKKVDNK